MIDNCKGCPIIHPDFVYDPFDVADSFTCSNCACHDCEYLHCCEGQCSEYYDGREIPMIDLEYATKKINQLMETRKELHYAGRADLDCLRQIGRIRQSVTDELRVVRAKLEVCPAGMIADLKKQEEALLEWKRKNA